MTQGCDMIVGLTHLPAYEIPEGIQIKRAYVGDRQKILQFVREKFPDHVVWPDETDYALMQEGCKCFIVVEDHRLLGFACYDACAKGFFGPVGIDPAQRGRDLGKALLIRTLEAMREDGYVYAIMGWVDEAVGFYQRSVGARIIDGATPENSVYSRYIELPD